MSEKRSTHEGHRSRMRARFEADPMFLNFSEHEILEMLLFYCVPRANTNELAHRLIDRFGSLLGVLSKTPEELEASGLVGKNTALSLSFFFSVSAYLQRGEPMRPVGLQSMRDVKEYVLNSFAGESKEVVKLFGISPSLIIKGSRVINRGLSDNVSCDLTMFAEAAVLLGSKEVLLAHNHPFSDSSPSEADISNTRLICSKLGELGISVVDHLIAGHSGVFSFRENGLMHNVIMWSSI